MARIYGPLVYRWSRRLGLQAEDSADVVQEVFRTVAVRVAGFRRERDGDTFRGWLWTITRNKLGDFIRKRRRSDEAEGGSEAQRRLSQVPVREALDPDSLPESPETSGLCRRVLEFIRTEFQESTWQAFWKVVVEDQEPADVAAEQGMSVNAVYLAKSRVLRRLREELGDVL